MAKVSRAHGMVGAKMKPVDDKAPIPKKPAHEFYPTPHNVTWALLEYFKPSKNLKAYDPCSGEGDMVLPLKTYGFTEVFASDLRDGPEIVGETRIDFLMGGYEPDADICIANPPFSLGVEFIIEAIHRYKMVCMLLKSQYWHAAGRVDLFNNHRPSHVLPISWRPDFSWKEDVPGGAPMMDVQWTCWNMAGPNAPTIYQPLPKPDKLPEGLI